MLFQIIDQLGNRRGLYFVRIDQQRIGDLRRHHDRLEFGRIECEVRIQILVHHQRRRRRRQQRIAVRSGFINELGADIAARAGVIFDDHRLAPFAREPFGENARDGVGGSAGREWHDDLDRMVREVCGLDRARKALHCGKAKCQSDCNPAGNNAPSREHIAH